MKDFKNTNNDKAWKELVYKMRDSDTSKREKESSFRDKIISIIKREPNSKLSFGQHSDSR